MFVKTDERQFGEVTEAPKVLKMSEAIRIGAAKVRECRAGFLGGDPDLCGCAIGTAWIGAGRTKDERFDLPNFHEAVCHQFGISGALFGEISYRHSCGESRESIADWLEGQGY